MGRPVLFRMMMHAKEMPEKKGGESFHKARGRGSIQLKCEEDFKEDAPVQTAMRFKLSVGHAPWRPGRLDFAQASVGGLPAFRSVWDLRTFADATTETFT